MANSSLLGFHYESSPHYEAHSLTSAHRHHRPGLAAAAETAAAVVAAAESAAAAAAAAAAVGPSTNATAATVPVVAERWGVYNVLFGRRWRAQNRKFEYFLENILYTYGQMVSV